MSLFVMTGFHNLLKANFYKTGPLVCAEMSTGMNFCNETNGHKMSILMPADRYY